MNQEAEREKSSQVKEQYLSILDCFKSRIHETVLYASWMQREKLEYLRKMNNAKKRLAKDKRLIKKWRQLALEADEKQRESLRYIRNTHVFVKEFRKGISSGGTIEQSG